jgi:Tol biopolymer transport system component
VFVFILHGHAFAQTPESTPIAEVDAPIAYQNSGAISVYEPNTGSRRIAPEYSGSHAAPDWSPDGTRIAFHGDFREIAYADVATGEVTSVATCDAPCAFVFDPAWSPDGTSLAFVRIIGDGAKTAAAQIVVVDLATGTEQVGYEDTAGNIWLYGPRWASDGQRLVVEWDQFASKRLSEERILAVGLGIIDLALANLVRLDGTEGGNTPDWSPTSDLIVFARGGDLATVAPDGSQPTQLTTFDPSIESAIQPSFVPDGDAIIFVWVHGVIGQGETPNIGVLSLSSGDLHQVADSDWFTHPRMRP